MSAGFDDLWRVWKDLERKEHDLRWGGGFAGAGLQYDSMGRRMGSSSHGSGGWLGEQFGRVERVRRALRDSGPVARQMVVQTFAGIEMSTVVDMLVAACEDFALYYGGSVIGGGLIGGVGGAFLGGVGAIPGAAAGMTAGGYVGGWILALLGLKSLVEGLAHSIPDALESYAKGFNEAWGPARQDAQHGLPSGSGGNTGVAAHHLARGHVILTAAILAAMTAYLTKGKSQKTALLQEVRQSRRLGPKVAQWLEQNEEKLRRHPALQSRRHGAQGAGPAPSGASPHGPQASGKPTNGPSPARTAAETAARFDREAAVEEMVGTLGNNIKNNPLRQEYEQKVAGLSSYAQRIRPDMNMDELHDLAVEANQARRQLGVQYKNLTPEPLRDYIYEVNKTRYGDPLGPDVDYLVNQGRTYTDIIKSASRPNPDVNGLLGKFGEWLGKQPDSYIQKHLPLIGQ